MSLPPVTDQQGELRLVVDAGTDEGCRRRSQWPRHARRSPRHRKELRLSPSARTPALCPETSQRRFPTTIKSLDVAPKRRPADGRLSSWSIVCACLSQHSLGSRLLPQQLLSEP